MIGTDSLLRHQYGRPVRFHHEAQRWNWPEAWSRVRVPVLVIQGEYDWIMPEEEHRRITRSLSPAVRRRATYVNVPRMGHDFLLYPSPEEAFGGTNGRFDRAVSDTILGWLRGRRRD
jgi:pimeloyl-ACP methyl ester carboxylesterase